MATQIFLSGSQGLARNHWHYLGHTDVFTSRAPIVNWEDAFKLFTAAIVSNEVAGVSGVALSAWHS